MTDICHRCGALIPLVGRVHRCVPNQTYIDKKDKLCVVTVKTHPDGSMEVPLRPKVTEIPPDWTYDKPRPVTLPPRPVTLRKTGVTLHSHPDCPVCKARRETNRKRVTKYRANRKPKDKTS